jgi:hypothetical protein
MRMDDDALEGRSSLLRPPAEKVVERLGVHLASYRARDGIKNEGLKRCKVGLPNGN